MPQISQFFYLYYTARTLRSSSQLLHQPATRINFQSLEFSITVTAPAVWNSLSLSLSGACQEDVAASTSVRHAGLSQGFCSLLPTTRSNISSAAVASDSNSGYKTINVLNIDIDIRGRRLAFSPGTLFGLTPLMIQTASTTSLTPSGGRCIARTSTTSFLFRDLRLASAASYKHT